MSFEELPNLIYTFILVPLGFGLLKTFHNSNRITKLEANQKNNLDKLDKIPEMCEDIAYIKGLLDEHLKKT